MAKKIKVYGWMGNRWNCNPAPNGSRQTREICAATSKSAVKEVARLPLPEISETGNAKEIEIAMSSPGVVFWRPIVDRSGIWTQAETII